MLNTLYLRSSWAEGLFSKRISLLARGSGLDVIAHGPRRPLRSPTTLLYSQLIASPRSLPRRPVGSRIKEDHNTLASLHLLSMLVATVPQHASLPHHHYSSTCSLL
ncbi:hypothetical protein SORBI_3009G061601 [Sorghum bicolor]|uniref:Uncharacterized protein n=1 Tax=Sorghum bicolor TaxID=4558 RepID=A0A1Z5R1V4_SORBI|nr:hypothetical protein SORBI_3009G061601 [Sorghum bicolor]